jgi:glycolate oxidase FAD binding subunit
MNASPSSNSMPSVYPDLPAILETVRAAAAQSPAQRPSFRIHGAGSHDFYGEALEGTLLETRGLSGILQYEPSELVVTVAAGTPLRELKTHWQHKDRVWPSSLLFLIPIEPTVRPQWAAWWRRA